MSVSRKRTVPHNNVLVQEIRDQEVARANRELAAYFKGQRTEREARGALKIIKAFIRDRERVDPKGRQPLPGGSGRSEKKGRAVADRDIPAIDQKARRRRARRKPKGAESGERSVHHGPSHAEPVPEPAGSAGRDRSDA
jgi:hypothetical protein